MHIQGINNNLNTVVYNHKIELYFHDEIVYVNQSKIISFHYFELIKKIFILLFV